MPGTTTTWYSPVSRAIGVTCDRLTGDLLVMIAPTITMPPIIIALPSPLLELTNCARPIVPPAPPLLSTVTLGTILSACIAACSARPVWSQPPPGAAGTRILRLSRASALPAAGGRQQRPRPEADGRERACDGTNVMGSLRGGRVAGGVSVGFAAFLNNTRIGGGVQLTPARCRGPAKASLRYLPGRGRRGHRPTAVRRFLVHVVTVGAGKAVVQELALSEQIRGERLASRRGVAEVGGKADGGRLVDPAAAPARSTRTPRHPLTISDAGPWNTR